jgi:chorismate-pyruvate lyase
LRSILEPFQPVAELQNAHCTLQEATRHPLGHLMDQSRFTVELCAFNHPNVLRAIEAKTGMDANLTFTP